MVSAATLIWISSRPLLRLMFCVLCGIAITKAGIFPPVVAAGSGRLVLNVTLPCLMFSKIVPAFTQQNISTLGPLILVALLYEAIGMTLAFLIKQVYWVPHRFRYGMLVAGGWGNYGDIPTAIVMNLMGAPPFQGDDDQTLGVAYISAFIMIFAVTMFPLGGHRLVAWDFQGPDIEPGEVQEAMRLKRKALFRPLKLLRVGACHAGCGPGLTKTAEEKIKKRELVHDPPFNHVSSMNDLITAVPDDRVVAAASSRAPTDLGCHCRQNLACEAQHTEKEDMLTVSNLENLSISACEVVESNRLPPPVQYSSSRNNLINTGHSHGTKYQLNIETVSQFLKALLTPVSMTIFSSFLIAFVPRLKALFVEVPGVYMPTAPDGQPPLAFILDVTTLVGATTVPLGLICLGSSITCLDWPKKSQWANLPLGAIIWIAMSKMVIIPILGVLICEGLTNVGLISRDDKVLRFVCIFMSCIPSATAQVLLTQIYSGTGSAEHLAPFLIPQYMLMFISMPTITAYAIQLLF